MKIVVNRGRTVVIAIKPGKLLAKGDGRSPDQSIPPVRKAYGPGAILEMPDGDAQFLIACGSARPLPSTPSIDAGLGVIATASAAQTP